MSKRVPPENSPSCKMWLVGEAPGAEEERMGRVFVGRAGKELDRLLRMSGVLRTQCHLRNVVEVRPPRNDFGTLYLDPKLETPGESLIRARLWLVQQVERYRPRVVVALGNEPLAALTGMKGVMKRRGSVYQITSHTRVVAALHPSFVMRQPVWEQVARADLIKAKREVFLEGVPLPSPSILSRPSLGDVREVIELCLGADLVGIDIEVAREIDEITSIALSWAPEVGICIPFYFLSPYNPNSPSYWSPGDEALVVGELQRFLRSPVPKTFHNAPFDLGYLRYKWRLSVNFGKGSIDTMLGHHILWPTLRKSLGFCMSLYTRYPFHKDMRDGTFEKAWEYNGLDAIGGRATAVEELHTLEREGMLGFYERFVHPLVDPVTQINHMGFKVNEKLRKEVVEEELRKYREAEAMMREVTGLPDYNPRSSLQAAKVLYEVLGFPPQYHHKTKRLTTSWKEVGKRLEKLASTPHQCSFLTALKASRKAQNVLSNWLYYDTGKGELIELPRSRLVTSFNIAGTISGRPSSSKQPNEAKEGEEDKLNKEGTNLLNVPHGPCRRIVVPDDYEGGPGELIFLGADLRQAEAMVVAYESGCRYLIEAFEGGKNVHIAAAEILFPGQAISKSPDPDSPYMLSKKVVHLTHYGGTEYVAAPLLGITQAEFRTFQRRYFQRCPEILTWQQETWRIIQAKRMLVTPFGRRLQFLGRLDDRDNRGKRTGISFVPQSVVTDVTNLVEAKVWERIELPERILLHHYDALVVQVRRTKLDMWKAFLEEAFKVPIRSSKTGKMYCIPVEFTVGENWDEV